MFCNNCGSRLAEEHAFCPGCGQQLAPASPKAGEQVQAALNVFPVVRKFSAFKQATAFLVFYRDKIAVAHLTKELQKQESSRLRQELKNEGTGFFKGMLASMTFWREYGRRYYKMSEAAILAESPENFALPYNQISQFYFRGWSQSYDSSDQSSSTTKGKIQLQLVEGDKIKFSHSLESSKQIRQFLTDIFGSRLKYRR